MTSPEMTSREIALRETTSPGNAVTGNDVAGITGSVMRCHESASMGPWSAGCGARSTAATMAAATAAAARSLSRPLRSTSTYLSHACFPRCVLCIALRHARCNPLTRRDKRQARRNNLNDLSLNEVAMARAK